MEIGRRIYYDKISGEVILDTGERTGSVVPTTIENDVQTFTVLSERNRESYDFVELQYGEFIQDFAESNGYRINPQTQELEFSYPDPNEPDNEQPYRAPLSLEVDDLKHELQQQREEKEILSDTLDMVLTDLIPNLLGGES